jgi:predicted dehydrogenase
MLKVGIIGTGTIAREHAAAIAMIPESATLVAATDISPERLTEFEKAFKVHRCYSSAAELIADSEVNLVAISTPPSAHEDAVVAALGAGKYVLCEKPLAQSLASAERISAIEARHPGRLSVCYQLQFAAQMRRMLWLIQNGWIGEVREAVVERHGYIPYSAIGKAGWWGRWGIAGGGVLMTQMIHQIDIMLQTMGEPCSVMAEMDTRYTLIESEDWIEAIVRFEAGRTARIAGSVNSGHLRGGLTIKGTLGNISPSQLDLRSPSTLDRALKAVNAALPDTKPAPMSLPSRAMRKFYRTICGGNRPELSDHALLYREIATRITNSRPLPVPPKEALRSLQLCAGIYDAAITGNEVSFPLNPATAIYGGISQSSYARRKRHAPPARAKNVLPKSNVVRLGLIGLDTTHALTFTDLLHNPYNDDHIPGAKIVAAFPGGSADMPISASRVESFTAQLRTKYNVPIMDSPEAVADAADVVFILSSDGRTHPGLFRSVAGRGRPVFVDKPFAISGEEAELIFSIARETNTKVFATSAFRYADGLVTALKNIHASAEKIKSCKVIYWGQIEPTQGRFFWYGIHGAEMLMTVMGKGVAAVEVRAIGNADIIEVQHNDGRRSSMIGQHNNGTFQVSIETDRRNLQIDIGGPVSARVLAAALDVLTPGGYPRLWRASDAGSVTGRQSRAFDPDQAETLEVIALLDAAQRSHASGQQVVV